MSAREKKPLLGEMLYPNRDLYEDTTPRNIVMAAQPSGGTAPGAMNAFGEDSPSYAVLANLLTSKYRKAGADELDVKCDCREQFQMLQLLRVLLYGSGVFNMYGPGVHFIANPFMSLGKTEDLALAKILHGDRTIVTVQQGHVGYCEDMGQPVLLPPGLHEWQSPTLRFLNSVDLNNTLIRLGPYTVLTVDEGYAAITQNNGKQIILEGGETHLLTHRNWKFEKFMSLKISTDDLQRIEATSADNVKMHTMATVVWRITDVRRAAVMSAETMRHDGKDVQTSSQSDMSKLRNDVLKQATASASAPPPVPEDLQDYSPIWDTKRMASAVNAANDVTSAYGVTILSINIISAVPADAALQNALAKGAVASAEAEQAETVARGRARAARILAEGDADADVIRAKGSKEAADMLSQSDIAVELARMDKIGAVLSDRTSFFFGSQPHDVSQLLSNPAVVQGRQ